MDAEAVMQLRMGLGWVFLIRGDAVWIVLSYWLDCIILAGSYCIVWIVSYRLYCMSWVVSGNTVFYALAGYWMDGTYGMDGLDGTLVGRGWYEPTLAGAGMGVPPLALEREIHHQILRGYRIL